MVSLKRFRERESPDNLTDNSDVFVSFSEIGVSKTQGLCLGDKPPLSPEGGGKDDS